MDMISCSDLAGETNMGHSLERFGCHNSDEVKICLDGDDLNFELPQLPISSVTSVLMTKDAIDDTQSRHVEFKTSLKLLWMFWFIKELYYNCVTTQTPSGSTYSTHRATPYKVTKDKSYQRSSNKRITRIVGDENFGRDDEDEEQREENSRNSHKKARLPVLWACPCVLVDADRHWDCLTATMRNFNYWVQHMRRKHICDDWIYCSSCWDVFTSESQRDRHQRRCNRQIQGRSDMIYKSEFNDIVSTQGTSDEDKWFLVWRRLYPRVLPEPSSPYIERSLTFLQQILDRQFTDTRPNIQDGQSGNASASIWRGDLNNTVDSAAARPGLNNNTSFVQGIAVDNQLVSSFMPSQDDNVFGPSVIGMQQFHSEFIDPQPLSNVHQDYQNQAHSSVLQNTPLGPDTVVVLGDQDNISVAGPLGQVQLDSDFLCLEQLLQSGVYDDLDPIGE